MEDVFIAHLLVVIVLDGGVLWDGLMWKGWSVKDAFLYTHPCNHFIIKI